MMKVELEYFKQTGKFYTDGSYLTEKEHMSEIFDEVVQLKAARMLPGLIKGHSEFMVRVDVPEHPHNCPKLIV